MVLSKKMVVVLVIVAIVLAVMTVYSVLSNSGEKVSTGNSVESTDVGKVGVTIIQPEVEDKLAGDENGG